LGLKRNLKYSNWGCAYAYEFLSVVGLDMFRLAIFPLQKEFWLNGWLGYEPRGTGWLLLKASMIGGGGPCPFLNSTLAFALQLRKSMENLRQVG
jgi:hypothetical protein